MAEMSVRGRSAGLTPWRFVVWFGTVSFMADFVYESARSVSGPLLASLGASATVVGLVTGAGEAAALGLRLVSGPLADRSQKFWTLTIAGYAITAVSVPLLGMTSVLWVVGSLFVVERVGKAIRSPAKDTMLSHATSATGRGKGFAVHQAMDQLGAFLGPLTVALILSVTGDDYRWAMGVLAVPGVGVIAVLVMLRRRTPDPSVYEPLPATADAHRSRGPLPRRFWMYAAFAAVTTAGSGTFGVLSFHMVDAHLLSAAAIPLLYACAMLTNAVGALFTGWAHDRFGAKALVSMPVLSAIIPMIAFRDDVVFAIVGALLWGVVVGVQESTLRATVADLVSPGRRATAYGLFAGVIGGASLVGGVLFGSLYEHSIAALVAVVVVLQVISIWLLVLSALSPPSTRTVL